MNGSDKSSGASTSEGSTNSQTPRTELLGNDQSFLHELRADVAAAGDLTHSVVRIEVRATSSANCSIVLSASLHTSVVHCQMLLDFLLLFCRLHSVNQLRKSILE